ncbi:hypothetical protein BX600DRAFT_449274 [Xylariales sp. PMI_506]|nr:hypothetical protein BX600DRAFT_449274 [Xylariales sp. PMI_506]
MLFVSGSELSWGSLSTGIHPLPFHPIAAMGVSDSPLVPRQGHKLSLDPCADPPHFTLTN